jgi:hypothetical protein
MFRAPSCPSSGAQKSCSSSLSFYLWSVVVAWCSSVVGRGRACRPDHDQQHCYIQQSPSWAASSSLASQEMPGILGNPHAHSLIHKCLSSVPILSHINPFHAPTLSNYLKILAHHYTLFVLLPVSAQVQSDCSDSYHMFHKNIVCVFHTNLKPEYLLIISS